MQNLIPCRFHIEVEAVLKSEGLRATKQRLNIWDELCSTDNHRDIETCLLYTSPSPRDKRQSRMPSSA